MWQRKSNVSPFSTTTSAVARSARSDWRPSAARDRRANRWRSDSTIPCPGYLFFGSLYAVAVKLSALVDTRPLDSKMVVEANHSGSTQPSESVTLHGAIILRRSVSESKSASVNGTLVASGGG